ncbi:MAG TPA: lysylphosphatidylglycerol synthase transmembrane domain-containing protein [candidate division Zixibacteria bacterium]|nr:lysylphosphatidylglycerol synthase transmembrane domain-containing protein [candidate division Zixibacteria bacterium]
MSFWEKVRRYQKFWSIPVALVILVFVLRDIHLPRVWETVKGLKPQYLLLVLAFEFLIPIFRAARWRAIITAHQPVKFQRVFSVYTIGVLANFLLPLLAGVAIRLWLLARRVKAPKTFAFSTMLLEVLFDAFSLIIFMYAASFIFRFPESFVRIESIVLGGVIFFFALFYLSLLHRKWFFGLPEKLLDRLPEKIRSKLGRLFSSFTAGLSSLRSTRHLVFVVLFSLASWTAQAGVIYSLNFAFGYSLPPYAAVLVMIINTVAIMIPITPGNVGVFQLATLFSLGLFSISKEEALSFSIILHFFDILPAVVFGSYFMVREHVTVRELEKQAPRETVF